MNAADAYDKVDEEEPDPQMADYIADLASRPVPVRDSSQLDSIIRARMDEDDELTASDVVAVRVVEGDAVPDVADQIKELAQAIAAKPKAPDVQVFVTPERKANVKIVRDKDTGRIISIERKDTE